MQPTPPRHTIRLGEAWEPPEQAGDRVHVARRFGRPAGLGPDDRVLLVIAAAAITADVRLNGASLPPLNAGDGRWAHDVTPLLRDRNELIVTVPASMAASAAEQAAAGHDGRRGRGRPPAAIGMVAIEIVSGV